MKKIISVCLMAVLLLLPLQIIALGDEQHDQNTQGTGEFIVETAEGLNNLESDAKSSDLFWSTSLQLAKTNNGACHNCNHQMCSRSNKMRFYIYQVAAACRRKLVRLHRILLL